MQRRRFTKLISLGSGVIVSSDIVDKEGSEKASSKNEFFPHVSLVVAGAGLGGCAAAYAALRQGLKVILIEETDWIGGQMTNQGVPPDEHQWIETHGAPKSYREYRKRIRRYYKTHYPLTEEAKNRPYLNPGDGAVSRLCHEPKVALAVLEELFAPYISNRQLELILNCKAVEADTNGDSVKSITVENTTTKKRSHFTAEYFIDATEMGDLLPVTGTEYTSGAESKAETNELHAAEQNNPENVQAFTMCFAMDYIKDANLIIDKPDDYDFWQNHIPNLSPPWSGKLLDLKYSNPKTLEPKSLGFHPEGIPTGELLNLWNYRRIINQKNFRQDFYSGDITIVNWPQNDFMLGNLIDADKNDYEKYIYQSKQLSLSLFYWLQTEAPRPDGGLGWPGLRLRGDILGTTDGMAKYPYVREARRIKALFTIKEEHVGAENRLLVSGEKTAATFTDSVGIGYYHIDLHPSCTGDNYIDFGSLPFQIPLGALVPQRMQNLIPANKNIGTTHITNGCYRLHPVEWSIGEAAGLLVAFAIKQQTSPHAIYENARRLMDFQNFIRREGVETEWKI